MLVLGMLWWMWCAMVTMIVRVSEDVWYLGVVTRIPLSFNHTAPSTPLQKPFFTITHHHCSEACNCHHLFYSSTTSSTNNRRMSVGPGSINIGSGGKEV